MSEARVRVSWTDGVIEFEGSETLVACLADKFAGVIQTALVGAPLDVRSVDRDERQESVAALPPAVVVEERPVASLPPAVVVEEQPVASLPPAVVDEPPVAPLPPAPDTFSDLYAETEHGLQVLKVMRGPKAVRTVTLAKLYLYGLRKLQQRETARFAEIADVCRAHGCYNSHNMASYLKADQASFIFGGTAKRQTLKLSAPGLEETAALIQRIRAGGKGIVSLAQGITSRRQGIAAAPEGIAAATKGIASSGQGIASATKGIASATKGIAADAL